MKFTMLPTYWSELANTISEGGHEYVSDLDEADFLVFNGGAQQFPESLPENLGFVQYTFAGVDHLMSVMDDSIRWANAGGVYGRPVAEVALGLILSTFHQHTKTHRAGSFAKKAEIEETQDWLFFNKTVALVGAGGIGKALLGYLKPFNATIIAVNRTGRPVEGADEVLTFNDLDKVWPRADVVVLSTPLTEQTRHMVGAAELAAMKDTATLVNVGRGALVETDALVDALRNGTIKAAGLDVMDPEPLPADHPLWSMDNVTITPHIAAPPQVANMLLAQTIIDNAKAFAAGEHMPTEVDVELGY